MRVSKSQETVCLATSNLTIKTVTLFSFCFTSARDQQKQLWAVEREDRHALSLLPDRWQSLTLNRTPALITEELCSALAYFFSKMQAKDGASTLSREALERGFGNKIHGPAPPSSFSWVNGNEMPSMLASANSTDAAFQENPGPCLIILCPQKNRFLSLIMVSLSHTLQKDCSRDKLQSILIYFLWKSGNVKKQKQKQTLGF